MLRIEELKNAAGKTYPDLEEATGIDRATIWRWAKGHQTPSLDGAAQIARALGVSLDELYVHDDDLATPAASRG